MTTLTALERLLRQDRLIVAVSLLGVSLLAWLHLFRMATDMPGMSVALHELSTMPLQPWSGAYFVMILLMWAVMMVGMMLPSAAPAILLFSGLVRQNPESERPLLRSHLFALGYLLAWTAFSVLATMLQWGIETAALQAPSIAASGPALGGVVLILAGIYQWTPLKDACLSHCRGPLDFLMQRWRRSVAGALRMGVEHGLYCVGCCWVLMGLLFVGGVMNLLWVIAITIFILLEKLLSHGAQVGRLSGILMIAAGALVLLRDIL
jgi:predicted metal-binding membrane protein